MWHSIAYKPQLWCPPFPLNTVAKKDNSTMKAKLPGIHEHLAHSQQLLSVFHVNLLLCLLAVCCNIHLQSSSRNMLLSVLTHQKPTWAEWVDVIVSPEEQIASQLARINLLRGGWGWTEGEPATKKVLLLHGMSCGGFLKGKDRNNSWFQDTGNQSFTPRWLRCFKAT